MKTTTFGILFLMTTSVTSFAMPDSCVKGKFSLEVNGAAVQYSFQLRADEEKETAQLTTKLLNPDGVMKEANFGEMRIGDAFGDDNLTLKQRVVRCPCYIYQSEDGRIHLDIDSTPMGYVGQLEYEGHQADVSNVERCSNPRPSRK